MIKFKKELNLSILGLLIGCSLLPLTMLQAQENVVKQMLTDSVSLSQREVVIPIKEEELPVVLSEIKVRSLKWANSLPERSEINAKLVKNDSFLVVVDSLLFVVRRTNTKRVNVRGLINLELFWKDQRNKLKIERDGLSSAIKRLQADRQKQTNSQLDQIETRFVNDSITIDSRTESLALQVIGQQDSINSEVQWRKDLLLEGLNNTITRLIDVELIVEDIEQTLSERERNLYRHAETPMYQLDYKGFRLGDSVSSFSKRFGGEWKAFKSYLMSKQNILFLAIGFVIMIVVLFYWLRNRLNQKDLTNLTAFQSSLVSILNQPLSAALLFGFFVVSGFFANAPPLMDDLMILILLVPILQLHARLIKPDLMPYLWLFAILILIRFIDGFMPQYTVGYRLLLLLFSLIQWIALLPWIREKRILELQNKRLNRIIYFTFWIHWIGLTIAIIANFLGFVDMARVFTEALVANLIGIIILYFSCIVLIGGLHFLLGNTWFQRFNVVRIHEVYLKRLVSRIVVFIALICWVRMLLRVFYVRRSVENWLTSLLTDPINMGSISFTLSSIFYFFLIIWLSVLISKAIKVVLNDDILVRIPLNKGVPRMITAISQFTIIVFGVLFATRYIGMPLDQLTIIFSAFSVGIGFGLQNIFNNLVSGVILLFERPIQIGDTVEVGTLMGVVKSMGIRSSNIKTFDGAEVIVPNGQLISQEVINWTLSDRHRRIEVISGVAYGSDVHRVKKLLLQVLEENPDIMKDPKPLVLFNAMGESSLDFRMLFWTAQFDDWVRVKSEIVFAVHDILYANDIEIPFPQRDLHIKSFEGRFPGNDE
ncbi:mechanosensitive ion channel family protein [Aureitalea marina]|uniref:Mechanosensitive ion channel protein MscS n=1 Tax=Aureitalea marina TaxID=930804 RepID=A0A2S7KNM5_9FLAO|nr:mechanosensitive ion channel domain-containing protein [Aureitalea marina]PQB04173.1 hypothetical protein BST85_04100 [Aureitalea marina]